MNGLLDYAGEDLLAWSPTEGWFMIVSRDPRQLMRLHEAHFIMSRDGEVLKHRHGALNTPKNDPLREHGMRILTMMGTDWIAGAIPQG